MIFAFPEIYLVAVPWCQKIKCLNNENTTNVHCCKLRDMTETSVAASVTSRFVALPFQKVHITNKKPVTLVYIPNVTITEGVKARILMLFVY